MFYKIYIVSIIGNECHVLSRSQNVNSIIKQ